MQQMERIALAGITAIVMLYFFWPHFESKELMVGLQTEAWVVLPIVLGVILYFLSGNATFMDKLSKLFNKTEAAHTGLEDPYICLDRYEKSNERAMSAKFISSGRRFKIDNEWVYVGKTEGNDEVYLILNGIKRQDLNSQIITAHDISSAGFKSLVDYKKSKKTRDLLDIGSSGISLRDIKDLVGLLNE